MERHSFTHTRTEKDNFDNGKRQFSVVIETLTFIVLSAHLLYRSSVWSIFMWVKSSGLILNRFLCIHHNSWTTISTLCGRKCERRTNISTLCGVTNQTRLIMASHGSLAQHTTSIWTCQCHFYNDTLTSLRQWLGIWSLYKERSQHTCPVNMIRGSLENVPRSKTMLRCKSVIDYHAMTNRCKNKQR